MNFVWGDKRNKVNMDTVQILQNSCEDNPWQRLKRFYYTSFERSQLVNFSQKENYRPMYFCLQMPEQPYWV